MAAAAHFLSRDRRAGARYTGAAIILSNVWIIVKNYLRRGEYISSCLKRNEAWQISANCSKRRWIRRWLYVTLPYVPWCKPNGSPDDFIEVAARPYVHALQHESTDIPGAAGLYADISRTQVLPSSEIVESAERVRQKILDTQPGKSFGELRDSQRPRYRPAPRFQPSLPNSAGLPAICRVSRFC
jgi:hypothetical protein